MQRYLVTNSNGNRIHVYVEIFTTSSGIGFKDSAKMSVRFKINCL